MRIKKLIAASALLVTLGASLVTRVEAGAGMSLPKDFSPKVNSYQSSTILPNISEYTILESFSSYQGQRIPWTYYEYYRRDVLVYEGYLDFIGREEDFPFLPPKYGFGDYIYKGDKRDFKLVDIIRSNDEVK